jgi:EAL domain-containing protein (putative c-di-GMP-specific phosphodiesterase class I)/FixJ family two-component response regulator
VSDLINEHATRVDARAALRQAVDQQALYLLFQPQVDLLTGHIMGAEALIRWHHDTLGDIEATDIIQLAEESDLILPISTWVLQRTCEAGVRCQQPDLPPVRVAVNLSAQQLNQPDIACIIESILMTTQLDPHCLTIEVTEGMLMSNLDHVIRTLSDLKSIGIQIALDDFGTGYASLSTLRRLPIDVIKIDRALVPDVTAATQDVSITRAIINMAHSMQMKVMAVGVENDGELALLAANQCDAIQGHYFSPAVSEADLLAMLQARRCIPEAALGHRARQRTMLIVDDEENVVSSLKRLLRRDGYQIVTANSGPQGLQRLAEHNVDVILSDQRMPGMTGVEFLRRAKELYPHTVRMVLSGYTELQSITDAINEGAIYKFLTKPWDDALLRTHIQEAFNKKDLSDENQRLHREVHDANRELAQVNQRLQGILEAQREQMHREEVSLVMAREVLENIPAPVIGIDMNGLIAFMNSDAEALFEGAALMLGADIQTVSNGQLSPIWQDRDGRYHDVTLNQRAFRCVCRAMTGHTPSRGALMVLTPRHDQPDPAGFSI